MLTQNLGRPPIVNKLAVIVQNQDAVNQPKPRLKMVFDNHKGCTALPNG